MDVCGHEVPLPAYWRIVSLHNQGKSDVEIVNLVMDATGSKSIKSITEVVHHVIENQRLMGQPTPPNPNRLSRSAAVKLANKPRPKSPLRVRLEEAHTTLTCAEELEGELANQAIALMRTRRRFARSIGNYDELKQAEAAIDRETKRVLQKRQAAEDEVEKAKMLVRQLEMQVAAER